MIGKLKTVIGLLAKTLVAVIVIIFLLEGGVRIVLYLSLNEYFAKTLPQPYGRIMQQTGHFVCFGVGTANRFDPICYYIPKRGFFRGPNGPMDWPKEKGAREIRIICIGDSTTFGASVDYDHSWVFLLGKALSEKYPGKKIRVLNAGFCGASSRQIKRFFQCYLTPYHPDIVIWRCYSMLTDSYSLSPASPSPGFFVWRCLYESRLFRVICALLDRGEERRQRNWPANVVYDFLTNRSPNLQPPAGKFDSDFSMVKKIAEEHGTRYALEVEYLNRGSRGVLGSEFEGPNHKGPEPAVHVLTVFEAYKKNNPSKDLFVDQVHLTERGEALTAQEISKFIIGNKWIETFH